MKSKLNRQKRLLYSRVIIISLAVILVIAAGLLLTKWWMNQREDKNPNSNTTQSSTPSNEEVSPGVSTLSPSASVSPVASPGGSPSSSTSLPQSAQTFLSNFYSTYQKMEAKNLQSYFTEDTTDLRSTLFTGLDTRGLPGGPTLFSSNSASERATSFNVIGSTKSGNNWQLEIQEQRVDLQGNKLSPMVTEMVIIPSGTSWLIDRYSREGKTGKYNAFLSL